MSETSRGATKKAFATATLLTVLSGCTAPQEKPEAKPIPSPSEACPANRLTHIKSEGVGSNGKPIFSVAVGESACNAVLTFNTGPYPFSANGKMVVGEQFALECKKTTDKPPFAQVHPLTKPVEGPDQVNVLLDSEAYMTIRATNVPMCSEPSPASSASLYSVPPLPTAA